MNHEQVAVEEDDLDETMVAEEAVSCLIFLNVVTNLISVHSSGHSTQGKTVWASNDARIDRRGSVNGFRSSDR